MGLFKRQKSAFWPALLSALVAPGVGQLVNREYKKGMFLLLSSITSFLWFSKVLTERLSVLLPGTPDQWANDPNVMREALKKLMTADSEFFFTFQILILLIWGFGVLDAYYTARSLQTALPHPPDENQNPVS